MARKNNFKTYKDGDSGLEWSIATTQAYDWDYAINYPENDLEDTSFHLPSLQEFQTLLDYTRKNTAFKKGLNYPVGVYWTSSNYANNPKEVAWCVDASDGKIFPSSKTNVRLIIAVRSVK